MAICRALLKHGYSNFSLTILEYCEVYELLTKEKYYLKLLKPEYNIAKKPGAPMSGRNHSEASRAKISASMTGFGKGIQKSDEHKAKISASMNAYQASNPNCIKIEVTDIELNTKTTYNSIHEAARALNINHCVISAYFRRNQIKPYKKRYVFTITKIDS